MNEHLSKLYDATIYLKREETDAGALLQGARAYNFFRKPIASGKTDRIFVCASAGNHAQGFAFACRPFRPFKGVVFMPVTTRSRRSDKTRVFLGGAFISIRLVGDIFDQCYKAAQDYVEEVQGAMVPPFDHEDIMEGQATVAAEILEQLPEGVVPDLIILPVGGGGLSAGVTSYLAGTRRQGKFRLCRTDRGTQLEAGAGKGRGRHAAQGRQFRGRRGGGPYRRPAFEALKQFSAEQVMLVPENAICCTMTDMLNIEGVVLEPAGALAIARPGS